LFILEWGCFEFKRDIVNAKGEEEESGWVS